jgi:hypothetical protein
MATKKEQPKQLVAVDSFVALVDGRAVQVPAYRVICANHVPDHSTITELRRRHATALAELFAAVLSLCRKAGLIRVGVIAIGRTKIAANASLDANRRARGLACSFS